MVLGAVVSLGVVAAPDNAAAPAGVSSAASRPAPAHRRVEASPRWKALTTAQRTALQPLAREWSSIDGTRKQKWIELADRFASLPEDEQARVQARMRAWADMSPQERNRTRMQFQATRELSADEREERWQAYQSLPTEQRDELADKAARTARSRAARGRPAARSAQQARSRSARAAAARQSPSTAKAAPPLVLLPHLPASKPVAPILIQARPGATTTLMSAPGAVQWPAPPRAPAFKAGAAQINSNTLLRVRASSRAAGSKEKANP